MRSEKCLCDLSPEDDCELGPIKEVRGNLRLLENSIDHYDLR